MTTAAFCFYFKLVRSLARSAARIEFRAVGLNRPIHHISLAMKVTGIMARFFSTPRNMDSAQLRGDTAKRFQGFTYSSYRWRGMLIMGELKIGVSTMPGKTTLTFTPRSRPAGFTRYRDTGHVEQIIQGPALLNDY